ncbi:hypothetical protein AB1Y20_002813 [Prymnesium parvum]|uniref:Uncharacterized protein n=1 Tax=Prymnesium parvum TaxID=97485 RepID=A0AB34JA06_PRYPA
MQEDDIDSLTLDFARLRESIRTELGCTGAASTSRAQPQHYGVPPPRCDSSRGQSARTLASHESAAAAHHHAITRAPACTDPSFHALRDSLLGAPSSGQCDYAAAAANTVKISVAHMQHGQSAPRHDYADPPTPPDSSLASQFESLRASIHSQLCNDAAGAPVPPADAQPAVVRDAPPSAAPLTVPKPARAHGADTVLINARKPACTAGSSVLANLDAARVHALSSGGRPSRSSNPSQTPARRLAREDSPTIEIETSETVFGYLAMKEVLQSQRRQYEAARAQIRTAYGLKKEGVAKPKSPALCKSTTKAEGPALATAARAKKVHEASESVEVLQEELSKLRDAVRSDRTPRRVHKEGASRGASGAGKMPIKKPSASEQVPIVPVVAPSRPPTFETVRQTERLVAATHLSQPVLPPEEPPPASAIGSGVPPQAASIACMRGEAHQAHVLCQMKLNSENIYRNTLSALH